MAIGTGTVTLQEVIKDLDLSAVGAGEMQQRAVLNKVGKQSGSLSLTEFRGNVLGQQLLIDQKSWGNEAAWDKKRYHSTAHEYIGTKGGSVSLSGKKIICERRATGVGGGDAGAEARLMGKVSESNATYRLTGTFHPRFYAGDNRIQCHVLVMASSINYLAGSQVTALNEVYTSLNSAYDRDLSFNKTFTVSSAYPFITVILRNVSKNGSVPAGTSYFHDFWDFKMVKV